MKIPFEVGDRVEFPAGAFDSHMKPATMRGSVTRVDWSNEEGYTEHIWVLFDGRTAEHEFKFAHGTYSIRKLDPIEALGQIKLPKKPG